MVASLFQMCSWCYVAGCCHWIGFDEVPFFLSIIFFFIIAHVKLTCMFQGQLKKEELLKLYLAVGNHCLW